MSDGQGQTSTDLKEYEGKLFLIVGPSGSGKGSVIEALKSRFKGFVYPVSYTTREMREGEIDGEVYNFISKEEFKNKIEADEFLEYAIVHSDNYYGTSKKDILSALRDGATVVREIDIQGFNSVAKIVPKENLVSIFMKVSDLDDLRGRILRRGELPADELERRMESALEEIAQAKKCDYEVDNVWGQMKRAVGDVEKIILSELKNWY